MYSFSSKFLAIAKNSLKIGDYFFVPPTTAPLLVLFLCYAVFGPAAR